MNLRPLGLAKEIIEDLHFEVVHAYDDLLFVEHNLFMVQFDDAQKRNFKVYFNAECEPDTADRLEQALTAAAQGRECTIEPCGKFELVAQDGASEFQVRFPV